MANNLNQGNQPKPENSAEPPKDGSKDFEKPSQKNFSKNLDKSKNVIKKDAQKKAQELLKSVNDGGDKNAEIKKTKRRRRRRRRSHSPTAQKTKNLQQLSDKGAAPEDITLPVSEHSDMADTIDEFDESSLPEDQSHVSESQPQPKPQLKPKPEPHPQPESPHTEPVTPQSDFVSIPHFQEQAQSKETSSEDQSFSLDAQPESEQPEPSLQQQGEPRVEQPQPEQSQPHPLQTQPEPLGSEPPLEPSSSLEPQPDAQQQSLSESQPVPESNQPESLQNIEPPVSASDTQFNHQQEPLQNAQAAEFNPDLQSNPSTQPNPNPELQPDSNVQPSAPEPSPQDSQNVQPYSFVEHSPEPYVYSYGQPADSFDHQPEVVPPEIKPRTEINPSPEIPPPPEVKPDPEVKPEPEQNEHPTYEGEVVNPETQPIQDEAEPEQEVPETVTEQPQPEEEAQPTPTPVLPEKEKFFPKFKAKLKSLREELTPLTLRLIHSKIARIIGVVFIVGILGFVVYTQGWWKALPWFQPPQVIITEPERVLPEEDTVLPLAARETVLLFGELRGTFADFWPERLEIVNVFGQLRESKVEGETGITAITFYGALEDEREQINQFTTYVEQLEKLRNLYSIDVYALLDRSTQRSATLLEYLDDLRQARTETQQTLQALQLNIDHLRLSYDSLGNNQTQFERDFFVALQNLEAEKSDVLLKSFIDINQKQIALRARIGALQKLVQYYNTALERVDLRILAIEQNTEALVQGIRVVDVPGSDIDIIVRPE